MPGSKSDDENSSLENAGENTSPANPTFVYPVKSLLAGKIQPAAELVTTPSYQTESTIQTGSSSSYSNTDSGDVFNIDHRQTSQILSPHAPPSSISVSSTTRVARDEASQNQASLRQRSNSLSQSSTRIGQEEPLSFSSHRSPPPSITKRAGPSSHYPQFPWDSEGVPRRFSTVPAPPQSTLPGGSGATPATDVQGLPVEASKNVPLPLIAAQALMTRTAGILPVTMTPPHDITTATSTCAPEPDYFSTVKWSAQSPVRSPEIEAPLDHSTETPAPSQVPGDPAEDERVGEEELPFNLSQYGIVHLPPLPPSRPPSDHSSSYSPSVSTYNSHSGGKSPARRRRKEGANPVSAGSHPGHGPQSGDGLDSSNSNSSYHDAFSRLSIGSSDPIMPVQFQHVEDGDGHYIVVGHEGTLENCEDEPIRTPGACQGFGVLIALDDKEDILVVRQVSENSTELLGLPPSYLFSLECFTDALPEGQVDVLWDNIHFLTDPNPDSDDDRSSPHIFLLSGWGAPGSAIPGDPNTHDGRRSWTCWCAAHRAAGYSALDSLNPGLIILEFELEKDRFNPLYHPPETTTRTKVNSEPLFTHTTSSPAAPASEVSSASTSSGSSAASTVATSRQPSSAPGGLEGDESWMPTPENIFESTTSYSKPIPALERLRRMSKGATSIDAQRGSRRRQRLNREPGVGVGMMDVFAVMAEINEQIGAAPDLDMFLKIVVGVIKDLTQFHRVMIYQFDEMWNGQVVAELVDWSQSHDLFKGLHFPASDIPAQARQLYAINKVRLLYDRSLPNARIVCRSIEDLSIPLDMSHGYLRAMSPIHLQYLENMGVRASMSISIMAFDQLWGLVSCHTYGNYGMRVSFPVRQILRLLSQSISRNIERLSYAQRLHTRKLVNNISSKQHPTGYIVSNADDLLGLFDADYGILVIGEGAKIIGPNTHGQEILIMAEYLRLKQFDTIQASQSVVKDFPDLKLTTGLEVVAGLLYVPLSCGGRDFIAFLRRGQPRQVKWAGRPLRDGQGEKQLEPRTSFKIWSETVAGRCRAWTDEQLETAGVLALVYGKFIEVWRQKQSALSSNKLANLILNNASHEVRTPLNHIINYLEMALNGSLDRETRENLSRSHAASKSLLFTINDLLDLTKIESGNETSFHEPFNLHSAIKDSTHVYKCEAERRGIKFNLELENSPSVIVGDCKKIQTVVQNLTANALKYTNDGSISVTCAKFEEPEGLRDLNQVVIEIVVSDTGRGIEASQLERIFREFERVESTSSRPTNDSGVGLGLAVVARIVEQLGGQLRVDSAVGKGSTFSFLIPLCLAETPPDADGTHFENASLSGSSHHSAGPPHLLAKRSSQGPDKSELEGLVQGLSASPLKPTNHLSNTEDVPLISGTFPVTCSSVSVKPVKIDLFNEESASAFFSRSPVSSPRVERGHSLGFTSPYVSPRIEQQGPLFEPPKLRALIVEDNDINRVILGKRLSLNGHTVITTTNGQEGLMMIQQDQAFDAVFMDIQMPILDGFEATERIREVETHSGTSSRPSHQFNNNRIPIFAVSASLKEEQREDLIRYGMDGWILKPIDFKRLHIILKGVLDPEQRSKDLYRPGYNWESGGWLTNGGSQVAPISVPAITSGTG